MNSASYRAGVNSGSLFITCWHFVACFLLWDEYNGRHILKQMIGTVLTLSCIVSIHECKQNFINSNLRKRGKTNTTSKNGFYTCCLYLSLNVIFSNVSIFIFSITKVQPKIPSAFIIHWRFIDDEKFLKICCLK